ncbi:MAG: NAD-dependent epimerase/dehydratase family protein [Planctomycetaceae bacterium]|nr:NAD-dependent epimerase/dehydratase family protein [Planctomycetales bacterium]MCB9936917.1 NAD-dependent epimerase/dehydratase family protein [Planctomycetaceae bacterium]
MRTLFVTGASGFIGSNLVRELVRRGMRCKCLVRATSSIGDLPVEDVELIEGSIEDPDSYRTALEGCDTVIHLAGIVYSLDESRLYQVNSQGCAILADACLATSQPPRLIYISSLAAAGPPPSGVEVRDENHPPQPVSLYGKSKRQGELLLTERAERLQTTIIRPGIVFGPTDKKLIDLFRPIYRWRVHVVVGFRTPPLSLIYIDDLVQLILLAVERGEVLQSDPDSSQGYYFACDDAEFPDYWQLGQLIAKSYNQSVLVWPLWRWVATCVGYAGQVFAKVSGRPTLLTVDKIREATVRSWACSSQKAREQFGFAPSQPIAPRVGETAKAYVDNGWV